MNGKIAIIYLNFGLVKKPNGFLSRLKRKFIICYYGRKKKKFRIRDTPNLLTDADSSTDIFVSAGVKKGADSNFVCPRRSL